MRDKATSAGNQQETPSMIYGGSSETIRQAPSSTECRAYLLGALHDGTFNKYNQRYRFSQSGTEWLRVLSNCLAITGNSSWIYREGSRRKVYVLETLAKFLDVQFDPSRLASLREKRAYLRGFFDAEGGIPKQATAKFYIQLVQNDKGKLEKLKILLREFGIGTGKIHNPSYQVDPDYFRMFVGRQSHAKFLREIGTWHPRNISAFRRRVKI